MWQQGKCGRKPAMGVLASAAVAAVLVISACGSTSSPTTSGSASSSASQAGIAAATAQLDQYLNPPSTYPAIPTISSVAGFKGKTIWWVPIINSVPTLAAMGVAMQAAAQHLGATVHVCDGKALPTTIAACLTQAAAEGAAAVVTGFVDYALIPAAYNQLVSHKIPVLLAGETPDGGITGSTPALAFYDTSPTLNVAGALSVDSVIADSHGKANILYIGNSDSPGQEQSADHALSVLKQYCPGCQSTLIRYATADIAKLPSMVSAALLSHPAVDYVICENGPAEIPALSGIQSAGRTATIKLAGANASLAGLQAVASGQVLSDAGESASYWGWQFIDGVAHMLIGQVPTFGVDAIRVFTKANVSSLSLTPADFSDNAWYGGDAFEQSFLTAWGVQ